MNQDKKSIIHWLKKMNYQDYLIHDNLVVDIYGDVDLVEQQLTEFPIQFGEVRGYFDCSLNQLKTLKGSPHTVQSWFNCQGNQLETLENGPKIVLESYDCSSNKLSSLKGAPQVIHKTFFASHNQLLSLLYCPQEMKGSVFLDFNYLTSLKGLGQCDKVLDISENYLRSLEYIPQTLNSLYCQFNQLTMIDYFPNVIHSQLFIDYLGLKNMYKMRECLIDGKLELHNLNQIQEKEHCIFKPEEGFNFISLNTQVFMDYLNSHFEYHKMNTHIVCNGDSTRIKKI
jgi:hypothetical protein